jgi:hypothetical protein
LSVISVIFCFEVNDENSSVKIFSGQSLVKYISLYNFESEKVNIMAELILDNYPQKQKPAYQIDLAMIKDHRIELLPHKKTLYPIYINAYKRLGRGQYVYWLKFSHLECELKKEDVSYAAKKIYKLPIVIVVK